MDILQFADKYADGLGLLAFILLIIIGVTANNIVDVFRGRGRK